MTRFPTLLIAGVIGLLAGCAGAPAVNRGAEPAERPDPAQGRSAQPITLGGAPAQAGPSGPAPAWAESLSLTASGPSPIDLGDVPTGVYDPNNKLDRGWGQDGQPKRIRSPLPPAEAERLRAQALLLAPGLRVRTPLAAGPATLAPEAGIGFDSLDITDCCGGGANVPPDPEVAVGPDHIIAVVNVAFEIYDKAGTRLAGPITFSSFFAGTAGCSSAGVFDPNVLYDEEQDRFILGIDGNGANYCVAASTGPNPLGTWFRYGFPTNIGGTFFDYPHAGVGVEAIFVGANHFSGDFFVEGRVFAMDKTALYAGAPMTVVNRSTGFTGGTPQPMKLHGFNQGTWPASGPHYIMTDVFNGATHGVWSWSDPFGANLLQLQGNLDLNAATGVTAGFPVDAPQAGSTSRIQANDWRGLDNEYRNGFIWMTNTIACNPGGGTVDCVRWAKIDPTVPAVVDAGVFGSNGEYRIFPDLAVNACGDMAVGYTKSGTGLFPSVWVTGREDIDPPGVLQAEMEMKAGEIAYTAFDSSPRRWGDYTGMTIDPDGLTFWYLGEYSKVTGSPFGRWGTFLRSFSFPACTVAANTEPVVDITAPADGAIYQTTDVIDFSATASDAQDGDLSGSLAWTSSVDGAIGSGASFMTALSAGVHQITAAVTDSGGLPGADAVTVTVTQEVTLTSVALEDGWVRESAETSGVGGALNGAATGNVGLRVGDDSSDRQLKSVVSFDTSGLPDEATVVSARLRLRRGTVVGGDPFASHGTAYVDVQSGGFSGAVALEAGDFEAGATAVQAGVLSAAGENGGWSEAELDAAGRAAIDLTGRTQLRVYFALDDDDDGGFDQVGYFAGDNADPANHPQLVVSYTLGGGGGNTAPSVSIVMPAEGATYQTTDVIDFSATASDAQDGDLSGSLAWTSSVDGAIGSGASFMTALSAGVHQITAAVTDSGGLPGADAVTVTVSAGGPQEVTLTSVALEDGWVRESAETSGVGGALNGAATGNVGLRVGDDSSDRQLKSVVSFDTSGLPDEATVVSARLRLRRGTVVGGDPFASHGTAYVDVQSGGFSGAVALEAGDFEAGAAAVQAGVLSAAGENGGWSEAELDAAGRAAIDLTGRTQLRVYFALDDDDDAAFDQVGYFAGDNADPANHPQLVVSYQ